MDTHRRREVVARLVRELKGLSETGDALDLKAHKTKRARVRSVGEFTSAANPSARRSAGPHTHFNSKS